jgi:pimeloyl-ACP methyl ester carboxylesterase
MCGGSSTVLCVGPDRRPFLLSFLVLGSERGRYSFASSRAMTTFVLVPGGSVGGWHSSEVADRLRKAGHRVEVIEQLPSGGTDPAALGGLAADAEAVKQIVERIGEPVILMGHSYGGVVITELADHPAVAHSVYLDAF